MKFLDQIAALEKRAAEVSGQIDDLVKVKDDLSNTIGDAARQLAALQQAIADAPKPFTIEISQNGQDFTVSEQDALALFAATIVCLDHKEPDVRLASGQTPKLRLTDLEQIAAKILEAVR